MKKHRNQKSGKQFFVFALVAVGLLSVSCESFLDVPPTSELESVYFENENRVDRGIGAIYSELGVLYCPNMETGAFTAGPLGKLWLSGDDLTVQNNGNLHFEAFVSLTTGDGTVKSYWSILYALIARANFMLEKLEDPKVLAVIETPDKDKWCKGEALFLRSWANIRLWDSFRKAPNQNFRIKTIEDSWLPPTKNFELLDQAIGDLEEAVDLLPDSWDDKNKGRVFKNSARGLLVKAYMLRACYAAQYEGGDRNGDYGRAIAWFEKMDNAVSTIEGVPFGDNFDIRKENNAESLFEYQASHNIKEDNPWLNGNFGGDAGAMGALYIQYWEHQHTNYMCGSVFGPTQKLISSFEKGDPRFDETILNRNEGGKDGFDWLSGDWYNFNGYQFIKYINGERRGDLDKTYSVTSGNNPRLLRLADVKLAVAEAYLQTGNEPAARQQLNDIRKRARLSTADGSEAAVPADFNTAVTMDDIMKERLLELAGEEDIRFSDMKRWHAAGYINLEEWAEKPYEMWGYDEANKINPFEFNVEKNLLLPIPQSEIEANPLMQADGNNPGYY